VMRRWLTTCHLSEDQWVLGFAHKDAYKKLRTDVEAMQTIWRRVRDRRPSLRGSYIWAVSGQDKVNGYSFARRVGPHVRGVYVITAGDTLIKIGDALKVPWQSIAEVNGLQAPYEIFAGSSLILP
jgi:hypothetical protein